MRLALLEARLAASAGEVPVGAVIAGAAGRILSRAHNERESSADPTAHAEVLAIRRAARELGAWRLEGAVLYVTLEPCIMCAGAALASRIKTVIFGASDPRAGAIDCAARSGLCYRGGVMERECSDLIGDFFKGLRAAQVGRRR